MKIVLDEVDVINHLTDHYQAEFGTTLGATVKPKVISRSPKFVVELDVDPIIEDDIIVKEENPEDVEL